MCLEEYNNVSWYVIFGVFSNFFKIYFGALAVSDCLRSAVKYGVISSHLRFVLA